MIVRCLIPGLCLSHISDVGRFRARYLFEFIITSVLILLSDPIECIIQDIMIHLSSHGYYGLLRLFITPELK